MEPGQWLTVPTQGEGFYTIPLAEVGKMLDLLQANRQGEEEPLDTLGRMSRDILQYERWVSDLQSGMYINCVYCGHRYGPAESTPVAMSTLLTKHIEKCPKHPLSHALATIANYQRIVNYWFPLLGYQKANEMAYPALEDPRATPAPALANEPAGEPLGSTGFVIKPLSPEEREPLLGFVIALLADYTPKAMGLKGSAKGWADVKDDLRAMALKSGMSPEAVIAWAEAGLPRDFEALKK